MTNKANNSKMNNYYLPAEWQHQTAIQLTWPHKNTDWHNENNSEVLKNIQKYFINLATTILNYQNLIIAADNIDLKKEIEQLLPSKTKYEYNIYVCPTNDTWARDHGPISLIDKSRNKLILDFEYNAWGGKYSFDKDNKITHNLYKQKALGQSEYNKINYILEGGSIDSNGQGYVLTTKSCILNTNRNNSLSDKQIIANLKSYLNIDNLIILENSQLYGDDTDGHIDMLARFCNANTIVYTACDKPDNKNYNNLLKLKQELIETTTYIKDYMGYSIDLAPLYIPDMIYNQDQELLPASYANFLIINGAVLIPTYGDKQYDQRALEQFKLLFPERDIIGINSKIAIEQGGSLHCLTMQIP